MSTYYEVILTNGNETFLIGYTARHSFSGLMALVRSQGEKILIVIGSDADVDYKLVGSGTTKSIVFGSWTARFSGNTERSVKTLGRELKRVGE